MKTRVAVWAGAAALVLLLGGAAWRVSRPALPGGAPAAETLPLPPLPMRIAEGPEYERCLGMVDGDPEGASDFAEGWAAQGGGDGAAHCAALADIALGDPEGGAAGMETLASNSHEPAVARASVFGQAGQAWLMAGRADRAVAAETRALALSPDDPDLLVSRAEAEAGLERYAAAARDLTQALAFDPRRVDALVERAAAWRELGQIERARDDVDRAFAVDGGSAEAYLERGILRQRMGDLAGARADWDAAVAKSPDTATGDLAQQNLALLEAGPERR